eukprot:Amastigsp_a176039_17.p1 type:complete len:575 gc:universal Amastigsp_a176039_17:1732-8(-)
MKNTSVSLWTILMRAAGALSVTTDIDNDDVFAVKPGDPVGVAREDMLERSVVELELSMALPRLQDLNGDVRSLTLIMRLTMADVLIAASQAVRGLVAERQGAFVENLFARIHGVTMRGHPTHVVVEGALPLAGDLPDVFDHVVDDAEATAIRALVSYLRMPDFARSLCELARTRAQSSTLAVRVEDEPATVVVALANALAADGAAVLVLDTEDDVVLRLLAVWVNGNASNRVYLATVPVAPFARHVRLLQVSHAFNLIARLLCEGISFRVDGEQSVGFEPLSPQGLLAASVLYSSGAVYACSLEVAIIAAVRGSLHPATASATPLTAEAILEHAFEFLKTDALGNGSLAMSTFWNLPGSHKRAHAKVLESFTEQSLDLMKLALHDVCTLRMLELEHQEGPAPRAQAGTRNSAGPRRDIAAAAAVREAEEQARCDLDPNDRADLVEHSFQRLEALCGELFAVAIATVDKADKGKADALTKQRVRLITQVDRANTYVCEVYRQAIRVSDDDAKRAHFRRGLRYIKSACSSAAILRRASTSASFLVVDQSDSDERHTDAERRLRAIQERAEALLNEN